MFNFYYLTNNENTGGNGGGIYVISSTSLSKLDLNNTNMSGNTG